MGQASAYTCPSNEQLLGITDCSDPCQTGQGTCAAVAGLPLMPSGAGTSSTLANAQLTSYLASSGLGSALPWILGGVGVVLLLGVFSGR
jgi:hypothetical protein